MHYLDISQPSQTISRFSSRWHRLVLETGYDLLCTMKMNQHFTTTGKHFQQNQNWYLQSNCKSETTLSSLCNLHEDLDAIWVDWETFCWCTLMDYYLGYLSDCWVFKFVYKITPAAPVLHWKSYIQTFLGRSATSGAKCKLLFYDTTTPQYFLGKVSHPQGREKEANRTGSLQCKQEFSTPVQAVGYSSISNMQCYVVYLR